MLFYYKREVKKRVPGVPAEDGTISPDSYVSEIYWDCFNVDKVIRGHWTSEDQFTVMLDDGHEQAEDVQKPKYNPKGQIVGVEVKRERGWYMSQIVLDKEDAERFKRIVELDEVDYSLI